MSSTTRKLSLSFPYLVPKKLSYSWATHQKTRYSSQPDSNPKTHNQVSKSLATTKTERREIRVLQLCHTTTNKQPRLDLVESFHDSCYACHHHHLRESLLDWSSPLPLFCIVTISVLLSITLSQSY